MGAVSSARARTGLRIVAALEAFGTSAFACSALRRRVESGEATIADVHPALVRAIFRLLFCLITADVPRWHDVQSGWSGLGALDVLAGCDLPIEALLSAVQDVDLDALDGQALGAAYETILEHEPCWDPGTGRYLLRPVNGGRRKTSGSYYTPSGLVDCVLTSALDPVLDRAAASDDAEGGLLALRVCDPACGAGQFLVGAAKRMALRLAVSRTCSDESTRPGFDRAMNDVLSRCIYGVDLDPVAVDLATLALWLESRPTPLGDRIRDGDAITGEFDWQATFPEVFSVTGRAGFDVVLGNPPFLNQLESATASSRAVNAQIAATMDGNLGPYTDISAAFLYRAVRLTAPGGYVGLVQPQSVLAARDAGRIRRALTRSAALTALWASPSPVFDASVLTCALTLHVGSAQGPVQILTGPQFRSAGSRELSPGDLDGEWSFLIAPSLGIPEVHIGTRHGVIGDVATCTADFRDQYYGLAGYVVESDTGRDVHAFAPLITSGLIDPAEIRWARSSTRFRKTRWHAPAVDLAALRADAALWSWAQDRLVPKVLVATQGRVIEAVADERGVWLPSVPTITVAADGDLLWYLLAVLLSPPVTAYAAARYAGTGLTMTSIKLSAKQIAALPLPERTALWDRAADAARSAQTAPDEATRSAELRSMAELMCRAYGRQDQALLAWWDTRVSRRRE